LWESDLRIPLQQSTSSMWGAAGVKQKKGERRVTGIISWQQDTQKHEERERERSEKKERERERENDIGLGGLLISSTFPWGHQSVLE